ncbi:MAG: prepilin peptidase [Pseudomonadota bacterium]
MASPPGYAVALLLGAMLGSFANVCILRIPAGASIVRPGSRCLSCGNPIAWYDNIPVFSYLLLRGRCRACRAQFSPRYMLVEAGMAMLAVATYHHVTVAFEGAASPTYQLGLWGSYLLLELVLVVLAFIDIDHRLIPDRITWPAIPFFLLLGMALGELPWWDLLLGAALGYGVVRGISDGYYYLTKREGLGLGDGKLLAIVGGMFGWRGVLFSLLGGSLVGTLVGLPAVIISRARAQHTDQQANEPNVSLRHVELPFGPFIVVAALAFLFLKENVAFRWWFLLGSQ